MNKFADLEALVAVVDTGSFSAAAERLGIAKSVISRRISLFEERLGNKLLYRTTRRLSLTDSGRDLYHQAMQILNDLHDAEQHASEGSTSLQGKIRIAAPLSFGLRHLSHTLATFMLKHPGIELDIDLNDREINLVEDGFDMAIRVGELQDSTLIAKRLGTIRSITCASPGYLERYGEPKHPEDLNKHMALQYAYVSPRQQWRFIDSTNKIHIVQPRIVMKANNGEVLANAACSDIGITSTPSFILNDYCQQGKLIPILNDYSKAEIGLYALFPPGRLISQRMRRLADFLASQYGETPYWDACLKNTH